MKILKVIQFGAGLIFAGTAGYFVYQATEDKAIELIHKDESPLNMMGIRTGQYALAVAAGYIAGRSMI